MKPPLAGLTTEKLSTAGFLQKSCAHLQKDFKLIAF